MTHYYLRATVGRSILRNEAVERDTIEDAQTYARQGFIANIRFEGFARENMTLDILHKPDPTDPRWSPSCRGRFHSAKVGWVWSYPPQKDG